MARSQHEEDLAVARARILERRERVLADSANKLEAVDALGEALKAGTLRPRDFEQKLREIDQGKGHPMLQARRAMGARAGTGPAALPREASQGGAVPLRERAKQGLLRLEHETLEAMMEAEGDAREQRLRVSLLFEIIQGFRAIARDFPRDPVLRNSIEEHVERAEAVLAALHEGGEGRWRYYSQHVRFLLTQAAALGAPTDDLKAQWRDIPKGGAGPSAEVVLPLFEELRSRMAVRVKDGGEWPMCYSVILAGG